jgi:hypothetical protein
MTLQLPHSIFFHIPKTGGTWVRLALQKAGVPFRHLHRTDCRASQQIGAECDKKCAHVAFQNLPPALVKPAFTFAFVRHPLSYYQSYWCYKMQHGWRAENEFDKLFANNDFEPFLWTVVQHNPGRLMKLYNRFLGKAAQGSEVVSFVGKQEHLATDLVQALRLAGEEFNEEKLVGTTPKNAATAEIHWKERCAYSPDLAKAVLQAEEQVLTRFQYSVEDTEALWQKCVREPFTVAV